MFKVGDTAVAIMETVPCNKRLIINKEVVRKGTLCVVTHVSEIAYNNTLVLGFEFSSGAVYYASAFKKGINTNKLWRSFRVDSTKNT